MIVVLTHNYPSEDNPVAGLFVKDHAEILRRDRGEAVEVFNYPFGEYPMTKFIKNPLKWPKFAGYFLTTSRHIKRDVETCIARNQGRPVDIIAHWWIPNGVFAARHFDTLHVICHGTDLYLLQKYPFIARWFANRARKVRSWQCVSNDLKRILLEFYPFIDEDKVTVKPMPIGPMFEDKKLPRQKNLIVSVGALIQRKGFDRLIREVARIPDLELEIYGEGPERAGLQRLINELNVTERVRMPGQITREKLAEVYNKAILFVLLSYDEGFGLVLKEAQACGCPTMAYVGDGMVDTGLDFPLDRHENVAERLREVIAKLTES